MYIFLVSFICNLLHTIFILLIVVQLYMHREDRKRQREGESECNLNIQFNDVGCYGKLCYQYRYHRDYHYHYYYSFMHRRYIDRCGVAIYNMALALISGLIKPLNLNLNIPSHRHIYYTIVTAISSSYIDQIGSGDTA